DREDYTRRLAGRLLVVTNVQVKHQVTDARTEVMQITPDQREEHQLEKRVGCPLGQTGERLRRGDTAPEQRHNDQRKTEEQERAADAVKNRRLAPQGHAIQVH